MILSIDCDLPTFKRLEFGPGLNILLSDKDAASGEKETRNSAGKSSLIEIIHFLLGAKADPESLARNPALVESTFTGEFVLRGVMVRVSRTGNDTAKIFIDPDEAAQIGLQTKSSKAGQPHVSNEEWKACLGHILFALPSDAKALARDKFRPSFRSLIGYFVRRRLGFQAADKHTTKQQEWDSQVNLSYLLGLDWRLPAELQGVRQAERTLAELKRAASDGPIGALVGTTADLRPQILRAEKAGQDLRERIAAFRVHESYSDWSDEASALRLEMLRIERQAVILKQNLAYVLDSVTQETGPSGSEVLRLYEAAGVQLPGTVTRRFDEVRSFHNSILANRAARLETEATALRKQIAEGEVRSRTLDERRSEVLRNLQSFGAFEDFVALQGHLAVAEAETATLQKRFEAAAVLEGSATELEIERVNLKRRLQEDHQARQSTIDRAISLVGYAIEYMYQDRVGAFFVRATPSGPEFEIKIQGDAGGGISQIEIFCLDLALLIIGHDQGRGPGFLVHDSHLFDPVDERQIALALLLGQAWSESVDGQYIVTLNSDVFDRLPLPDTFNRSNAVLDTRLYDLGESGGLFGIRFD